MTLKAILSTAEKFVTDNSPGILTGLGVAGTVTVGVLAGRAGFRAGMDASTQYHEALREGQPLPEHLLEGKHLVKTYWKEFVPPASVGVATIAAIITANKIGARRAAAIAAAFKLSEQLSEDYKKKVVETLGIQKEEKVRSELAAEKIAANPPSSTIIIAGSDVLFYDEISGRYFSSEVEKVRKSVNDINHQVTNYGYSSLGEFYDLLNIPRTPFSNEVGWNQDELLDVTFSPTLYEDNKPAIMLSYKTAPIHSYDRCQ